MIAAHLSRLLLLFHRSPDGGNEPVKAHVDRASGCHHYVAHPVPQRRSTERLTETTPDPVPLNGRADDPLDDKPHQRWTRPALGGEHDKTTGAVTLPGAEHLIEIGASTKRLEMGPRR